MEENANLVHDIKHEIFPKIVQYFTKEEIGANEKKSKFKFINNQTGGIPFIELILINSIMHYLENQILSTGQISKDFCFGRNILI